MKIISIISNLNKGGAEGNFYRLNNYYKEKKYKVKIICLTSPGYYSKLFDNNNLEVYHLNLNRGKLTFNALFKIYQIIKHNSPDVVQTWMYHSDLIGGYLAMIAGVKQIHWNVRHSSLKIGSSKFKTIIIAFLCSISSYFVPTKIFLNSFSSLKFHKKIFYCKRKMQVIFNGIDTNLYKPNNNYKNYLDKFIEKKSFFKIGMVARFDKQKDHLTFLKSIDLIINSYKINNFHFFFIGRNIKNNSILSNFIKDKDLLKYITLIDHQNNIDKIMNSLDLHVLSSSYGDSFPNVLLESMACGTPSISTDIGDAKLIINNNDFLVNKSNANLLCKSIMNCFTMYKDDKKWRVLQNQVRKNVIDKFNLIKMTDSYDQELY